MLKKLIDYFNERREEKLRENILKYVLQSFSSDPQSSYWLRYEVDYQFRYIKGLTNPEYEYNKNLKSNWIKISDKLPILEKYYLIKFEFEGEYRYQVAFFNGKNWLFFCAGIEEENITHWGEIPN